MYIKRFEDLSRSVSRNDIHHCTMIIISFIVAFNYTIQEPDCGCYNIFELERSPSPLPQRKRLFLCKNLWSQIRSNSRILCKSEH